MSLLDDFRDVHREILQFRNACEQASRSNPDDPLASAAPDPAALSRKIGDILDRRSMQLDAEQSVGRARLRIAEYVVCAYVDEVMLTAPQAWIARAWEGQLLETARFGSQEAGDRFFALIDQMLLYHPLRDPDLAETFFAALALGFKGRYRAPADESPLAEYCRKLASSLGRRPVDRICLDAYRDPPAGRVPASLPDVRRWALVLVGLGALYLVAADVVWRANTAGLARLLDSGGP
jgi:type VI secretion system protein ImpK